MKKNNNITNILNNINGRFFTIAHASTKGRTDYCAKLVRESEHYLTIDDVNRCGDNKRVILNKKNIREIKCGNMIYSK